MDFLGRDDLRAAFRSLPAPAFVYLIDLGTEVLQVRIPVIGMGYPEGSILAQQKLYDAIRARYRSDAPLVREGIPQVVAQGVGLPLYLITSDEAQRLAQKARAALIFRLAEQGQQLGFVAPQMEIQRGTDELRPWAAVLGRMRFGAPLVPTKWHLLHNYRTGQQDRREEAELRERDAWADYLPQDAGVLSAYYALVDGGRDPIRAALELLKTWLDGLQTGESEAAEFE